MGLFNQLFGSNKEEQPKTVKIARSNNRNTNACPYCGTIIEPAPKRKKKCEACGRDIYIRTTQPIFNSDLLRDDQAKASDFYKDLMNYGATVEDYEATKKTLSNKWGFEAQPYDVVWSVSNNMIARGPDLNGVYDKKNELLQYAKMITFSQALYQYGRDKDPSSYLSTVSNYDIEMHSDYEEMELLCNGCCDTCAKMNGKRFKTDELRKNPVLPIKGCTHKMDGHTKYAWCACMLLPVTESIGGE